VKTAFCSAAVSSGVLLHPNHQWYLSAAHTEDDIDTSLDVCASAAEHAMRTI
jgi:glutamate-1-semialdehyde 2,1-aminomutase